MARKSSGVERAMGCKSSPDSVIQVVLRLKRKRTEEPTDTLGALIIWVC